MKQDFDEGQTANTEAEDIAAETNTQPPKSEIEILQEELAKKSAESQKYYDQYLRSLAEVENMRKRAQRDKEEYMKYAHVSIIKKLLPVIDDFNRGIAAAQKTNDFEALSKGVEITARNLTEILKQEGVVEIECLGKPFDPEYHEPLMVVPSEEHPQNTVIEELSKGYILHDRLIRPSLVKVSS
ncbi:GrpE nucleotide exchange factor [Syntrophomonas zehnderi OL-4]|uniref:Protein GrpE n=1 Tax=Syntrophomonas zehnderi OL-4 TaxID=690567 RepID=A0A0E4GEY3_9FIRM|nr:nucleotide exchange factor GrpE [Syntrophomonas zehnderi]CFX98900.1 GrpE nucleotide exchange factor [Syntrophomonas zehnderi OL-4]